MLNFISGMCIGAGIVLLLRIKGKPEKFDEIQAILENEERLRDRLQEHLRERASLEDAQQILEQIRIHNRTIDVLKHILIKF